MKIKSKVDGLIAFSLWLTVIVTLFGLMTIPKEEQLLGYAIGGLLIVFMLSVYFGTYYEFRDEYLYCRSGPFVEKIAYGKIKSIKLCHNLLSSMALSTERIEIRQHGKSFFTETTYISPVDRETAFIELSNRCHNLEQSL